MAQDVIAIICDCDGTLCPDTTDKLVRELGLDSNSFWRKDVDHLVQDGWDHTLAYLNCLLEATRNHRNGPLDLSRLRAVGLDVDFYPGALDFVDRIRGRLSENSEYDEAGVTVEWYIVSSGIEDILSATPLFNLATDIFGCAFGYDSTSRAEAVKRSVTFTEKTKFIHAISKGISGPELRRRPYRVNDAMKDEDRRVPFEHMVYIGDGPSDIPCFSMIRALNGKAIGVWPPEDTDLKRPYELAQGERLTVGPYTADYQDGSDLYKMLWRIVEGIADSILEKREHRLRAAPNH
ncbi:MAG: hypothetical protein BZY88_04190 [SAR202 cluster bacterium Io17-Chloro-G9]|nr:MAG: hypothetical protein BZY88_04190 [SAR202 cluster bacterium Io17-Chloro-G9]